MRKKVHSSEFKVQCLLSLFVFLLSSFHCLLFTVAYAEELVVSSVPEQIHITLKYAGEKVTLFGEAAEGENIVVKVTSMESEQINLSKKGKRGLFWLNVKSLDLSDIPKMYQVYTSRSINDIPKHIQMKLKVDRDYSAIKAMAKVYPEDNDREEFINGYIKMKERQGLYAIKEGSVKTIKGRLFKSEFFMPSHSPVGSYMIEVFAVKGNIVAAFGSAEIKLQKVGIESWLSDLATRNGISYGILSVIVALATGIGVGLIFREGPSH